MFVCLVVNNLFYSVIITHTKGLEQVSLSVQGHMTTVALSLTVNLRQLTIFLRHHDFQF